MKTVLFISKSEHAASTRYRALNYFPHLLEAGWHPYHIKVSGGFLDRIKCLKMASQVDVVVVIRRTYDGLFRQMLRKAAKHLIFDFDDAIYLHRGNLEKKQRLKRFKAMLEQCDQAWCGNEHLADQARTYCQDASVVPTSVNVQDYNQSHDKPVHTIDLVWIGSQSTRQYLQDILPNLENAAKQLPSLKLKIIADFALHSSVLAIEPITWNRETEGKELITSHIGLAPLTDDPWTSGKCGLKVLQYMASRLPVISSRASVNQHIVLHEQTGLLVDEKLSWEQAVLRLASLPGNELHKMGDAGYQRALEHYDIHRIASQIINKLNNLV